MSIEMRVYGHPAPQGSKKAFGNGRMVEASKALMPWREAIVSQILRQGLHNTALTGPTVVRAVFLFDRPKSHYGTRKGQPYLREDAPYYVTKAPDLDKLQRAVGDALTQGGLIHDDDQICRWEASKRYCAPTQREGALIEVFPA